MNDIISRAAAIDAIVAWTVEDRPDVEMPTDLIDRIKALPSAQPEIIRCKDCAKRNALGYCTMFQNNIHGIATSWYMPDDNDFCSYAERRTDDNTNKGSSC